MRHADQQKSICLCMIVKNEAEVITRSLDSVRPFINHWVIVDTGSTDGTQGIIREYMRDIEGTLYERPWHDFATNRSEALALARNKADYSLMIDADDVLEVPPDFQMPNLTADCYMLEIRDKPLLYWRKQLVNNRLEWLYRGVLHEFITSKETHSTEILPIGMQRNHDGARRKDPTWFLKDVETLERALKTEKDPLLVSRYTFYLAQSYRDSNQPTKALWRYTERSKQGGWNEEVYISHYSAGRLMESLGYPEAQILNSYEAATRIIPGRQEARHAAAKLLRLNGKYLQGYEIAKPGIGKDLPPDSLFAEPWIYETGLRDEFAVNAYWAGKAGESLEVCLELLETGKLQEYDKQRVVRNLRAAWEIVRQPGAPKNLGALGAEPFIAQYDLKASRALHTKLDRFPNVLIAIHATQSEELLQFHLENIANLEYPKSSILVYIQTTKDNPFSQAVIQKWADENSQSYAHVDIEFCDFKAETSHAAKARTKSIKRTLELGCDFYFACDVENFIRAETLIELIGLNLPISAPFLRSLVPERYFSNYHAEVDANGYYAENDQYLWILNRWVRGIFEVPLVHCTYLVRADVIEHLSYEDGSGRDHHVVFAEQARKAGIPQYIDNRQVYGYIAFPKGVDGYLENAAERARYLLSL